MQQAPRAIRTGGTEVPVPIEWIRRSLHLTQKQLLAVLAAMGVECSLATLTHVETGRRNFSPEMSMAIGTALSKLIHETQQPPEPRRGRSYRRD